MLKHFNNMFFWHIPKLCTISKKRKFQFDIGIINKYSSWLVSWLWNISMGVAFILNSPVTAPLRNCFCQNTQVHNNIFCYVMCIYLPMCINSQKKKLCFDLSEPDAINKIEKRANKQNEGRIFCENDIRWVFAFTQVSVCAALFVAEIN